MHTLPPVPFFTQPLATARIKSQWLDFQVKEQLAFEPDGAGEHHYLLLEKWGVNTEFLAKKLMDVTAIPEVAIGFAGRKDRHGVTKQWFSLHSHEAFDWPVLIEQISKALAASSEGRERVVLHAATRHSKKLRKGQIARNDFVIRLRELSRPRQEIESILEQRIAQLIKQGYLNYFGVQRLQSLFRLLEPKEAEANIEPSVELGVEPSIDPDYGYRLDQCHLLDDCFSAHFQRKLKRRRRGRKGFDLSIARSFLFNQLLYDQTHQGGVVNEQAVAALPEQLPLYGESRHEPWQDTRYAATLQRFPKLTALIESQRIEVGWRSAQVRPEGLSVQWLTDCDIECRFSLSKGSYATVLLAHLFDLLEVREL